MSRASGYVDLLTADQREEKLPQWAQQTLRGLRKALSEQWERADQARLATSPDETDTIIDKFDDIPIGLPAGGRVRFRVGPSDLRDYVEVRVDRGGIELMAGGPMVLIPQVTNVLRVELRG